MHDLLCKTCTDRGLVGSAKGRIFNNMLICANCALDESTSVFIRDTPIFLSERMLHKDYDRKGSVEKKNLVVGSQGAWRQDEVIDDKPPVVK
jgi:hypothetical protein